MQKLYPPRSPEKPSLRRRVSESARDLTRVSGLRRKLSVSTRELFYPKSTPKDSKIPEPRALDSSPANSVGLFLRQKSISLKNITQDISSKKFSRHLSFLSAAVTKTGDRDRKRTVTVVVTKPSGVRTEVSICYLYHV